MQSTLKRVIGGVTAIALSSLYSLCFAQAGAILASTGDNRVDRDDRIVAPLHPGTTVQAGDAIITAPTGRLQVRFVDGAILSMQPDTRFRIQEHQYDGGVKRSFFSLIQGAIRMASGLIGKTRSQDFRLSTPSATIGIRGTHFVVEHTVCDPLCSPGKKSGTRVSVTDGRIVVSNRGGEIELRQHESALITDANTMPELVSWTPDLTPRSIQVPTGDKIGATENAADRGPQTDPDEDKQSQYRRAEESTTLPVDESVPRDSSRRDNFSRWVNHPPRAWRDRRRIDNRASTLPSADFDRPVSLPGPFDGRARGPGGLLPDLVARQPGSDDGGEEPMNEAPQIPEQDNPAPPGPGPTSGLTDTTGWLVSLRPLPALARDGLISSTNRQLAFDDDIRLESIGQCESGLCLSRGTARVAEVGHDDFASWGRWTNGRLEARVFGLRTAISLSANQGLHYIVGVPAVSVPTSGSFTYNLIAATAPTMSHDWYSPGRFSGAAAVQFAPGVAPRIGLNGQVSLAGDRFNFSTNGGAVNPGTSQLTLDGNNRFSGDLTSTGGAANLPWMCGSQGCNTEVQGALFGPNGERLGLSYTINSESGSTTIDGVGIFSRP